MSRLTNYTPAELLALDAAAFRAVQSMVSEYTRRQNREGKRAGGPSP